MVQFNDTEWSPTNSGGWSPTMDAIFMRIYENAKKRGIEKGLKQSLEQGREQVAIEMLKKDFATDLIAELTHLEQVRIEELREALFKK